MSFRYHCVTPNRFSLKFRLRVMVPVLLFRGSLVIMYDELLDRDRSHQTVDSIDGWILITVSYEQ